MHFFKLIVVLFFVLLARQSSGSLIAYSFQGHVTSAPSTSYGFSIPLNTPVSGHFVYDTNSSLVSPFTDTYLQHRTNGFYAKFGAIVELSADDYWVIVSNNILSGTRDQFDIRFRGSDLSASCIKVDSISQPVGKGLLHARLRYGANEFASTSLPPSLSGNLVAGGTSLLSDDLPTVGGIDVLFSITSIAETTLPLESTAVPEPATDVMAVLGLAGLVGWLRIHSKRGGL
jgi:hypothetical protein